MQARISAISTGILLLALTRTAAAASVHEDGKAGVRFPIPFAEADAKTATQVTALVLADGKARLPEGVEITSGVYSRAGTPYLVVWTKPEARPPTQKEVLDLAAAPGLGGLARLLQPWLKGFPADLRFDRDTLRGVGSLVKASGTLRSKVLLQVTRDASVYVALFFDDPADSAQLDVVAAGLTVLPGRSIRFAELAPGGLALRTQLAFAGAALAALAAFVLRRRLGRNKLTQPSATSRP